MSGRRRLTVVAVLAAAAVAASACGVPVTSSPQALQDVPAGLLRAPAATHVRPLHQAKGVFDIYLVAGDQLVEVARPGPVTPQSLVAALNTGPNTFETNAEGITTDLPAGAHISIVKVNLRKHVATVNLDASVGAFSSLLGVAQIVYTVTQLKGVTEVAFYQSGAPVDVPNENGHYFSRPLTRADFARDVPTLPLPPPPTATTTTQKCSLAVGSTCH